MNDWIIVSGGVTHSPSSSHFSFYSYPDTTDVITPNIVNMGSSWDAFFLSKSEAIRKATSIWREHLEAVGVNR